MTWFFGANYLRWFSGEKNINNNTILFSPCQCTWTHLNRLSVTQQLLLWPEKSLEISHNPWPIDKCSLYYLIDVHAASFASVHWFSLVFLILICISNSLTKNKLSQSYTSTISFFPIATFLLIHNWLFVLSISSVYFYKLPFYIYKLRKSVNKPLGGGMDIERKKYNSFAHDPLLKKYDCLKNFSNTFFPNSMLMASVYPQSFSV